MRMGMGAPECEALVQAFFVVQALRLRNQAALEPGDDAATLDKAIAATAIVAWVGVIYWGRMLPFLGNAF